MHFHILAIATFYQLSFVTEKFPYLKLRHRLIARLIYCLSENCDNMYIIKTCTGAVTYLLMQDYDVYS